MVGRRRSRGSPTRARGPSVVLDLGPVTDVATDGTLGDSFDALFDDAGGQPRPGRGEAAARVPLDVLPAGTEPSPGADAPARPWYRNRLAWATAAVAVAVSGSLVFTSMVEGTRVDDVTQLAGGIHPLRAPPSELWSVPRPGRAGVVVTEDAVVVVEDRLLAYTVAEGNLLWRSEPVADGSACLPGVGQETADVIVCLAPPTNSAGGDERDQDVRVTTYDPSTGKLTGERTTRIFGKEAAVVGGEDLVRVHAEGDEAVVVREDARTGEVRWERRLSREHAPGRTMPSVSVGGLSLGSARGVLSVLGPGIAATYTLDGAVLEVGDVWSMVQLPDGRYVGNRYGRGVATVFDVDGEPEFQIQGRVLEAPLSDGSAPGVIVANTFSGVAGVDAATGAPLWEVDSAGHQAVLRLGGQIVVRSDTSLRAVDVRTGEQTWIVRLVDAAMWRPLTDGESVYVTSGVRGGDPELVSVSLQHGYVEWRAPLPDGTFQLFAVGGTIVVLRDHEVVALS